MPRDELNGWTYSYTDEGSGPALVFNHGILMDRSIFDDQIEELKHSYRCVAIDAPGHGESSPAEMGTDFYAYGDTLTAVAQQLGIETAIWIGQSMGGFINLRLALSHPDLVAGLVLIDTQAHPEDAEKRAQYEAFLKVSLEDGVGEDLAGILIMLLFGETFAGRPESDVWRKKLMTQDIEARHAMVRAVFERDDVHERLREIRVPAIVIHGREDVAIEPERAEELARDLPDATVEFIDECGHCSPHERGAAVTTLIRSFLERIGY